MDLVRLVFDMIDQCVWQRVADKEAAEQRDADPQYQYSGKCRYPMS